MSTERLAFIDWMKAIGITLIVFGHVAGGPINGLTAPVYPKQLGVAFFVFVMGFGLTRESRPLPTVFYLRLFDVWMLGAAAALLTTAWSWWTRGDLGESNYLPLLGGLNVLINDFPLNPTTWYIGTYLHLLLLWAICLRNLRIGLGGFVAWLAVEIAARAVVTYAAGSYIAYMLVPNWVSVFLLGRLAAQKWPDAGTRRPRVVAVSLALVLVVIGVMVARWSDRTAPFMQWKVPSAAAALCMSGMVSAMYLGWTSSVFLVLRHAPVPTLINFVARNTVLVFIVHMPVFFAIEGVARTLWPSYPVRAVVLMLVCMVVPACISEVIRAPLQRLRRTLAPRVGGRSSAIAA